MWSLITLLLAPPQVCPSSEFLTYLYICIYAFNVGTGKNQCSSDSDKADLDDKSG